MVRLAQEGGSQSSNILEFDKKYNQGLNVASQLGAKTYAQANTGNFTPNVKPATTSPVGGYNAESAAAAAQAAQVAAQKAAYQRALDEARGLAKSSTDSYYASQEAGFGRTRDRQITDISKAYDDAVAQGRMSEEEANLAYQNAVKGINDMAYKDSQLTQLMGFDRGIQNSQQLLGLQAGDNARKMNAQNDVTMERDRRVNTLKDRIAQITKQKDLDVAQANTDYNYNITGARADADRQYNDYLMELKQAEMGQINSAVPSFRAPSGGSPKGQVSPIGNYDVSKEDQLLKEYQNYLASKHATFMDGYNTKMQAAQKSFKNPNGLGIPYPSYAQNPNITDWEKYRQITGG